jgi:hypothetical protein
MKWRENEIKEAVKTLKVPGANNIFLSLSVAAGSAPSYTNPKCTLIEK